MNHIVLRSLQCQILQEFLEDPGKLVRQMIMGAGKTTVIAPLLNLMNSDGEQLLWNIVPSALVQQTIDVLREKFSSILSKKTFLFQFERSEKCSIEDLTLLYQKIILAKKKRNLMISSPEAVKSIYLKFIEWENKDDQFKIQNKEKIEMMKKILCVLKNETTLILDEVDLLLHPLKSELNFPIGQKRKLDLLPERYELAIHIFDSIRFFSTGEISVPLFKQSTACRSSMETLKERILEGISKHYIQNSPHLILLNPSFYHQQMKPILIDLMMIWLQSKHVINQDLTKETILQYLKRNDQRGDGENEMDFSLLSIIKDKNVPARHIQFINLIFDYLNVFVPHCLSKVNRVNYGLLSQKEIEEMDEKSPVSRSLMSIPFSGKDVPSKSSEFAHPDILIALTILGYSYEGMRKNDLTNTIKMLQRNMLKEAGPRNERTSSKLFRNWIETCNQKLGKNYQINDLDLFQLSDKHQFDKVMELLQRHLPAIYFYLTEKVFPSQLQHHEYKISASGGDLGSDLLFKRRFGFSGTPNDLIPMSLDLRFQKGADGKIIHVLTNPDVVSVEVLDEGWTVKEVLMKIATEHLDKNALIDTAALITGMSNRQVAEFLLKHGRNHPHMKGIVYLDEENKKMVLIRGEENEPIKLSECGIGKNERFTIYDQIHTTGIDIKQHLSAVALQTIGKDSTLRDIAQGSWRMRGIGQGQKIHFVLIPEIYKLIQQDLGDHFNKQEDQMISNIVMWLILNSIKTEEKQFLQLQKQNFSSVWKKLAYETLLQTNQEEQNEENWMKECREIYKEEINFDVNNNFYPETPSLLMLIEEGEMKNQSFVQKDPSLLVPITEIRRICEEIASANSKTADSNSFDSEQEKESEVEIQQEKESEQENQQKIRFSRDFEEEQRWSLSELTSSDPSSSSSIFYPLNYFKIGNPQRNMLFPNNGIFISQNYYKISQKDEYKRMKNMYFIVDWIPQVSNLKKVEPQMKSDGQDDTISVLSKVFDLFDTDESQEMDGMELSEFLKQLGEKSDEIPTDGSFVLSKNDFVALLMNDCLNDGNSSFEGRYFLCLSLEELESIRFLIHTKHPYFEENCCLGIYLINGFMNKQKRETSLIASTPKYCELMKERGIKEQEDDDFSKQICQIFKFLDVDFYYSRSEVGLLLNSLEKNTRNDRKEFFETLLKCKRREKQKFSTSPVSKIFVLKGLLQWMLNLALRYRLKFEIQKNGLKIIDIFSLFDINENGFIEKKEMIESFKQFGVEENEIIDFVEEIDQDGNDILDLNEFSKYFEDGEDGEQKKMTNINESLIEIELNKLLVEKLEPNFFCFDPPGNDSSFSASFFEEGPEKELTPVEKVIRKMFSQTYIEDGYAFKEEEGEEKITSQQIVQHFQELAKLYNAKEYEKVIEILEKCLVESLLQTDFAFVYSIAYYSILSMKCLGKYQSVARKMVLMFGCKKGNHDKAIRTILESYTYLVDWAFEEWKLKGEEVKKCYEELKEGESFQQKIEDVKNQKVM